MTASRCFPCRNLTLLLHILPALESYLSMIESLHLALVYFDMAVDFGYPCQRMYRARVACCKQGDVISVKQLNSALGREWVVASGVLLGKNEMLVAVKLML